MFPIYPFLPFCAKMALSVVKNKTTKAVFPGTINPISAN